MKNLQKLNLVELDAQEVIEIEGGNRLKKFKEFLEALGAALGIADATDRFIEGWNSVKC